MSPYLKNKRANKISRILFTSSSKPAIVCVRRANLKY